MTPASTDVGASAATLRPPAAAITSVSFPTIEVMASTFSEFSDLKKFLSHGVNSDRTHWFLLAAREVWSILTGPEDFVSFAIGFEKKPGWNAGLSG
jgi:hypothetical protein